MVSGEVRKLFFSFVKREFNKLCGHCNLKQLQMNPPKKIGTSKGFEPMASALTTHTLGAGQFVEFTLIRE